MANNKTLFLSELYPPTFGGTCVMFASRFGLLPKDEIVVLTQKVPQSENFDRTVGYKIKRIPILRSGPKGFEWLGPVWSFLYAGLRLALKERVDRIECARFLPEGVAAYIIATLLRKPLIVNYHGEEVCVLRNYKVERFLLKLISRKAAMNLANSNFTANSIKETSGSSIKINVVVPGFNPRNLQSVSQDQIDQLRASFGGAPVLLTIGRMQQRKGQDHVIRALPEIIPHSPNIRYVIVGSSQGGTDGFEKTLKELAKEVGVSQHVVFAGEIDNATLPTYYAACDAFIMANRTIPPGDVEGFGIVFLEAGFMGKPVIGGSSGGVPDAVHDGETGYLVDGNDTHDIAEKILTILRNPDFAKKMGNEGRNLAMSMTHKAVFMRYQEIMKTIS